MKSMSLYDKMLRYSRGIIQHTILVVSGPAALLCDTIISAFIIMIITAAQLHIRIAL